MTRVLIELKQEVLHGSGSGSIEVATDRYHCSRIRKAQRIATCA
jgi:hypothetical protein